jgi:hypothetical protein
MNLFFQRDDQHGLGAHLERAAPRHLWSGKVCQ